MAWRSSGSSNAELVQNLKDAKIIRSSSVFNAMLSVDRGHYIRGFPYQDAPQPIGHGMTISAPHMHAHALQLLSEQLIPGKRALDIGAGSGYLTVCMAKMVDVLGSGGVVIGVETLPSLVELGRKNVRTDYPELLESDRFNIIEGDGWNGGPPQYAPYDAIHVGAAASEIPPKLVEQLAKGGKLIVPVEGRFQDELMEVYKDSNGEVHTKALFPVSYVKLVKSTPQDEL